MTLLDVQGVSYTVGQRAIVDDIDLAVSAGEIVGLVGPNGAGKSSAVRLVAGEIPVTAGSLRIGGGDIGSLNALTAARRRAVLPQSSTVRFPFRAVDIVRMGRFPLDTDHATDDAVCRHMMERTDTAQFADHFYPTLSGGEQARVNLARVLVQEAPLLVLDEPAAALDVRHQQLVMRLLQETVQKGAGCLVVLHDLNLAAAFADRLVVMSEGGVVADGRVSDVLEEKMLSEVYQQPMAVVPHPERDGLLVLVRESKGLDG